MGLQPCNCELRCKQRQFGYSRMMDYLLMQSVNTLWLLLMTDRQVITKVCRRTDRQAAKQAETQTADLLRSY